MSILKKNIHQSQIGYARKIKHTYTQEPFELSEYFWRTDEFRRKTRDIFATINTPTPITISQPSQDIQELNAKIRQLQQQIKDKDEQIQALTDQLQAQQKLSVNDDKELTATSQKAVAKFLYTLLVEHGYELGAKKGNTNDMLQALTTKHNVPLSREFIATWLDRVNNLETQTHTKSIIYKNIGAI